MRTTPNLADEALLVTKQVAARSTQPLVTGRQSQ